MNPNPIQFAFGYNDATKPSQQNVYFSASLSPSLSTLINEPLKPEKDAARKGVYIKLELPPSTKWLTDAIPMPPLPTSLPVKPVLQAPIEVVMFKTIREFYASALGIETQWFDLTHYTKLPGQQPD